LNFRQLRYRIEQLGICEEDGRSGRDDSESLAEGEGRDV
jgi:two-component system response regulator PilR (NtrC family)